MYITNAKQTINICVSIIQKELGLKTSPSTFIHLLLKILRPSFLMIKETES